MSAQTALIILSVIFTVLDFTITVGYLLNLLTEDPKTVKGFPYRFNRICFVGCLAHILLSVDGSGSIRVYQTGFYAFLWMIQYMVLAVVITSWLVLWIESLIRTSNSAKKSVEKIKKVQNLQIYFLSTFSVILIVWFSLNTAKKVNATRVASLLVNFHAVLTCLALLSYSLVLVYQTVSQMRRAGKKRFGRKHSENAGDNAAEIRAIIVKSAGISVAILSVIPVLLLLIIKSIREFQESEKASDSNVFISSPTISLIASISGSFGFLCILLFSVKISFGYHSVTSLCWKKAVSQTEQNPAGKMVTGETSELPENIIPIPSDSKVAVQS